jgi:hypothetical protein
VDAALEGELGEGGVAAVEQGRVFEHDEIFAEVSVSAAQGRGTDSLRGWRDASDGDDGLCVM